MSCVNSIPENLNRYKNLTAYARKTNINKQQHVVVVVVLMLTRQHILPMLRTRKLSKKMVIVINHIPIQQKDDRIPNPHIQEMGNKEVTKILIYIDYFIFFHSHAYDAVGVVFVAFILVNCSCFFVMCNYAMDSVLFEW